MCMQRSISKLGFGIRSESAEERKNLFTEKKGYNSFYSKSWLIFVKGEVITAYTLKISRHLQEAQLEAASYSRNVKS